MHRVSRPVGVFSLLALPALLAALGMLAGCTHGYGHSRHRAHRGQAAPAPVGGKDRVWAQGCCAFGEICLASTVGPVAVGYELCADCEGAKTVFHGTLHAPPSLCERPEHPVEVRSVRIYGPHTPSGGFVIQCHCKCLVHVDLRWDGSILWADLVTCEGEHCDHFPVGAR